MADSVLKAIHTRLQEFIRYPELQQMVYNVAALQQQKDFHSLAVLSFLPEEGKTLFCAALAMAYAETCKTKVLVVDTVTYQNKRSLTLGDCFNGSAPMVEVKSLEELRSGSGPVSLSSRGISDDKVQPQAVEPEVVSSRPARASMAVHNDFSLIKQAVDDLPRHYGLVLIDTAPLLAKNRSNVDPLLVARLSEASVLLVSRRLLDTPKLGASLKMLEDPSLHLIGMISNETHCP